MFNSVIKTSAPVIARRSWFTTASTAVKHMKPMTTFEPMFLDSLHEESFRNSIANKLAFSSDNDTFRRSFTPQQCERMKEQLRISNKQLLKVYEDMQKDQLFRNDIANRLAFSNDDDSFSRPFTPKLCARMEEQLRISSNQLRDVDKSPMKSNTTIEHNRPCPILAFKVFMAERQWRAKVLKNKFHNTSR